MRSWYTIGDSRTVGIVSGSDVAQTLALAACDELV